MNVSSDLPCLPKSFHRLWQCVKYSPEYTTIEEEYENFQLYKSIFKPILDQQESPNNININSSFKEIAEKNQKIDLNRNAVENDTAVRKMPNGGRGLGIQLLMQLSQQQSPSEFSSSVLISQILDLNKIVPNEEKQKIIFSILTETRIPKSSKYTSFEEEELYSALERTIKTLKSFMPYAGPFIHRVSSREVPDYYNVISHPIDLSKIRSKLKSGEYNSKKEFENDLNLIKNNCYTFNTQPDSIYRHYVDTLINKSKELLNQVPDITLPQQNSQMNKSSHRTPNIDVEMDRWSIESSPVPRGGGGGGDGKWGDNLISTPSLSSQTTTTITTENGHSSGPNYLDTEVPDDDLSSLEISFSDAELASDIGDIKPDYDGSTSEDLKCDLPFNDEKVAMVIQLLNVDKMKTSVYFRNYLDHFVEKMKRLERRREWYDLLMQMKESREKEMVTSVYKQQPWNNLLMMGDGTIINEAHKSQYYETVKLWIGQMIKSPLSSTNKSKAMIDVDKKNAQWTEKDRNILFSSDVVEELKNSFEMANETSNEDLLYLLKSFRSQFEKFAFFSCIPEGAGTSQSIPDSEKIITVAVTEEKKEPNLKKKNEESPSSMVNTVIESITDLKIIRLLRFGILNYVTPEILHKKKKENLNSMERFKEKYNTLITDYHFKKKLLDKSSRHSSFNFIVATLLFFMGFEGYKQEALVLITNLAENFILNMTLTFKLITSTNSQSILESKRNGKEIDKVVSTFEDNFRIKYLRSVKIFLSRCGNVDSYQVQSMRNYINYMGRNYPAKLRKIIQALGKCYDNTFPSSDISWWMKEGKMIEPSIDDEENENVKRINSASAAINEEDDDDSDDIAFLSGNFLDEEETQTESRNRWDDLGIDWLGLEELGLGKGLKIPNRLLDSKKRKSSVYKKYSMEDKLLDSQNTEKNLGPDEDDDKSHLMYNDDRKRIDYEELVDREDEFVKESSDLSSQNEPCQDGKLPSSIPSSGFSSSTSSLSTPYFFPNPSPLHLAYKMTKKYIASRDIGLLRDYYTSLFSEAETSSKDDMSSSLVIDENSLSQWNPIEKEMTNINPFVRKVKTAATSGAGKKRKFKDDEKKNLVDLTS